MSDAQQPTVQTTGVEHTGFIVNDTEKLASWYVATFGAQEISRSGDQPPIIFLSFGRAALIELIPAANPSAAKSSDHVHLCLSVSDISSALTSLEADGIRLDREPFDAYDGSRVAFLRDPEGNLVQLVQRVDGSAVHRAVFD